MQYRDIKLCLQVNLQRILSIHKTSTTDGVSAVSGLQMTEEENDHFNDDKTYDSKQYDAAAANDDDG